ncbi:cation transporter [Yunchengibacter salinarum]|uniref:cation transporter n=1 Tax=Yunchengibacter salinarum TaxID=3133399 RepID=UPI0035B63F72
MGGNCHCQNTRFEGLDPRYRRALYLVIAINAVMFLVEMPLGFVGDSQAMKADALDFLGDSLTYGLSLAVLGMSLSRRATAALVKGVSLGLMGLWVMGGTLYAVFVQGQPSAGLMGGIGVAALAANLASVALLIRFKDGDANVRSVWLCSRNDAINNLLLIGAASGVWASKTPWPDLIVAGFMAGLFLWGSAAIIRQAGMELKFARRAESGAHRNQAAE